MGFARSLARDAWAEWEPSKDDRLTANHPLVALAAEHPGELLWRVESDATSVRVRQPPAGEWQVGAASARALREADVAAFNAITKAAAERRSARRKGHH